MEEQKIKNCPFCGGEAYTYWWLSPYAVRYPRKNSKIYHPSEMFKVYGSCGCKECNIEQGHSHCYKYANHDSLKKADLDKAYKEAGLIAVEEAIKSWNTSFTLPFEKLKEEILADKEELLSERNDCIALSENEVNAAQEYVYDRVINIIGEYR